MDLTLASLMRLEGNRLPDPQQQLLLKICVNPSQFDLESWKEWSSHIDLQQLEPFSLKLMPMLYAALQQREIVWTCMPILKGAWKKNWTRNTLLQRKAASLTDALAERGAPVLLVGDIPRAFGYFLDAGQRPCYSIDFAVAPDKLQEAIQCLRAEGWQPDAFPPPDSRLDCAARSFCSFCDAHGDKLYLRWRLIPEDFQSSLIRQAAQKEIPAGAPESEARTLAPEEDLIWLGLQGMRSSTEPFFPWIADAGRALLTAQRPMDWKSFLRTCESMRMAVPIAAALECLKLFLPDSIPDWVSAHLRDLPVSRDEVDSHALFLQPPGLIVNFRKEWRLYSLCCSSEALPSVMPNPFGFISWMQHKRGDTSLLATWKWMVRRTIRRSGSGE